MASISRSMERIAVYLGEDCPGPGRGSLKVSKASMTALASCQVRSTLSVILGSIISSKCDDSKRKAPVKGAVDQPAV